MPIMSRKARDQEAGVGEAIRQIEAFRRHLSLSVLALARHCAVSQPALARFLDGERKTISPTARIVLEKIAGYHKQHNWHSGARIPSEIEDAVRLLWDGKPQSADLVATLIKALKPVLEVAIESVGKHAGKGAS